jgi:hypothetical protein
VHPAQFENMRRPTKAAAASAAAAAHAFSRAFFRKSRVAGHALKWGSASAFCKQSDEHSHMKTLVTPNNEANHLENYNTSIAGARRVCRT